MADPIYFSRVKLLDGTYAEVKDTVARQAIAGGVHFMGVTTTALEDMQTISVVSIGGTDMQLSNGDIVIYNRGEFVFAESDGKVHELGDLTGLGALAMKNSATGSYTPAGTVSTPDIDVTPTSGTVKEIDNEGSVTAGTANVPTVVNVTPGTADVPTAVDVTPGTANVPTAVTLPTLAMTMGANETLEFVWTNGSVTPGTAGTPTAVSVTDGTAGTPTVVNVTPGTAGVPTAVTLPTTKNANVLTGVAAALHERSEERR